MITVRAFARYKGLLGFERLELPCPGSLDELLADARFAALPKEALLAVNQAFAGRDAALKDGDEVAFMPPVSGG